jgi:hypothetical protein
MVRTLKFKIGEEIWVRDKVRSTAESEPSVLPENGVWRDSKDIQKVAPRRCPECGQPFDEPGKKRVYLG